MVETEFKSHRKNLKATLLSYPDLAQNQQVLDLCKEYDMCRIMFAGDMNDAVKFGVLEHMMRISTSAQEAENFYQFMSGGLALKLKEILARKEEINQLAIREMEEVVGLKEVRECKEMPSLQVILRCKNGKVTRTQIEPDVEGDWPVVHLLDTGQLLFLLYPTMVSFLDGYEPYTGEPKDPLIPASLLDSILPSLYFTQTRRTFSTQTKPVKTKEVAVPKKTVLYQVPAKELELYQPSIVPVETPPVEEPEKKLVLLPPEKIPQLSLFGNITEDSPKESARLSDIEPFQPIPFQSIKPRESVVRTPSVVIKKQPQPQPEIRTTTRKIVIHKGKQERTSARNVKPVENEVESTETSMENWEWVNFDRQATAKHKARENCGDDCGLF